MHKKRTELICTPNIIMYKIMRNCVWAIFLHFSKFIFLSKTNNAKIISLIIFYVFTLLLLFLLH